MVLLLSLVLLLFDSFVLLASWVVVLTLEPPALLASTSFPPEIEIEGLGFGLGASSLSLGGFANFSKLTPLSSSL